MVAADQMWEFGGLRLDPAARTLLGRWGEEIILRRSEYELLLAFVRHPGRVLGTAGVWRECGTRPAEWAIAFQ
jgi:DNA-binding response OmpR family regulator